MRCGGASQHRNAGIHPILSRPVKNNWYVNAQMRRSVGRQGIISWIAKKWSIYIIIVNIDNMSAQRTSIIIFNIH